MKNYKKQTEVGNFTDLFGGYYYDFINCYDFDYAPLVKSETGLDLGDVYDNSIGKGWVDDILIDSNYNLLLPDYYQECNVEYGDCDESTGHNKVPDSADYNPDYSDRIISFKDVIFPWIMEEAGRMENPLSRDYDIILNTYGKI